VSTASKDLADPANRPVASDVGDITRGPNAGALPHKAPRWLLWAGAGAAAAICVTILLIWGIHGPTYLFDLIAAYCL